MELRHLRYFIAVAEEGNFSNAVELRLHAAQPLLSRQIRAHEIDVAGRAYLRQESAKILGSASENLTQKKKGPCRAGPFGKLPKSWGQHRS